MDTITLRRTQSGWLADFEGPGAAAIVDFFGSASIPTGYASGADAVNVAYAISSRYYGWTVRVVDASGETQAVIG